MGYPFSPFITTVGFNKPASYGVHEGIDLNGPGGGNSDCGTPIKSISKGKCIHISQSTANYGNLAIIETIFNGVTYYIRYCHLNIINVRPGDTVNLNQVIGTMGSTGNSTACHLHLDILKKNPGNWRFYSQNVLEWFVDPVWFINNYKEEEPIMSTLLQYLDVPNEQEAKNKLKAHLGEFNGKCDWGNEADGRGGFLGGDRRRIKQLEARIKELEQNQGSSIPQTITIDGQPWRLQGVTYNK